MHGGNIRLAAEMSNQRPEDILDFSANLNPVQFPNLGEILTESYGGICRYPDNRYQKLREVMAGFTGVRPDNIVPGNGSTELIKLFLELMVEQGKRVLIPTPTYGEYERSALSLGCEVEHFEYELICNTVFMDSLLRDADVLFICNPNNPTGDLLGRDQLQEIVSLCEQNNAYLFVDEVFIELSDMDQSIADLAIGSEHVFILRSLTKCFAIAGLRIGYGVTNGVLADNMNNARLPWSVNSIAEKVAIECLKHAEEHLARSRKLIHEERGWLQKQIARIKGCTPLKSDANFMLIQLEHDSTRVVELMLKQGVLVRDCKSFSIGDNHIRVAIRTHKENQVLIDTLKVGVEHAAAL